MNALPPDLSNALVNPRDPDERPATWRYEYARGGGHLYYFSPRRFRRRILSSAGSRPSSISPGTEHWPAWSLSSEIGRRHRRARSLERTAAVRRRRAERLDRA
jgi:hypothetical protein